MDGNQGLKKERFGVFFSSLLLLQSYTQLVPRESGWDAGEDGECPMTRASQGGGRHLLKRGSFLKSFLHSPVPREIGLYSFPLFSCLSWILFLSGFCLLTLRLQTTFSFSFSFSHKMWASSSIILATTAAAKKFGIMEGPEKQV